MTCLDPRIKIQKMLDTIRLTKSMLADDAIRPSQRNRLNEELTILKKDLKEIVLKVSNLITIKEEDGIDV